MLNTEHAYFEAGYKYGKARVQRDESRAEHWKRWINSALALEKPEDKNTAERLWRQGYAEAQPIRQVY